MKNVIELVIYFARGPWVFKRGLHPGMKEVRVSFHGYSEESIKNAEEFASYLNRIKVEQIQAYSLTDGQEALLEVLGEGKKQKGKP